LHHVEGENGSDLARIVIVITFVLKGLLAIGVIYVIFQIKQYKNITICFFSYFMEESSAIFLTCQDRMKFCDKNLRKQAIFINLLIGTLNKCPLTCTRGPRDVIPKHGVHEGYVYMDEEESEGEEGEDNEVQDYSPWLSSKLLIE